MKKIPVCEPLLNGNESKYVAEAIETNWISSSGKFIEAFEQMFSSYCETDFGISCSNGTTALHIALKALDIGPGDEVILPNFTLVVNANMIILSGAKPVFVDVDKNTWCINPDLIEEKITPRTKAIMVVHMYGHPCEMDSINAIAKKHKLHVIEDAAQSHGATYHNKKTGGLGHISTFSFYANKIITTGEGGMVLTRDQTLAEKCRSLRNQAHGQGTIRYIHETLGYNYRFSNVLAAIGLGQCEHIEKNVNKKRQIGHRYLELLKDVSQIQLPYEHSNVTNVYWMFGVVLKEHLKGKRDLIMQKLLDHGIDTRSFFWPLNKQPVYQKDEYSFINTEGHYPVSEFLGHNGFYLPSGLGLSSDDQELVSDTLIKTLRSC
ncbi:MAG: DegT/DnrJ/EryC1/StrS family aminotransferase [Bdellovibrionales bacterium]|nr:DegT/DnrJ/EryC1/StrS family aminotransferase [Bdellovibrionales bacterium]